MQQHPPPSFMKSPALFPPTPAAPLSTEDVQKVLEENKRLILAVMESQNLGKVAEAAQYRTQLQNNLWYLTAIADAAQPQPQAQPPTTPPSQLASFQEDNHNHHLMGGLQQQQQQLQSNVWPPPPHPRSPFERDQQHLMLLQQQQHYHQAQQAAATHHQPGFGIFSGGGGTEVRGNRLEFLDGGFGGSSSQRNSVSGHGVGDIESFF